MSLLFALDFQKVPPTPTSKNQPERARCCFTFASRQRASAILGTLNEKLNARGINMPHGGQWLRQVTEQPAGTGVSYIGVKPLRGVAILMSLYSINDPKHWLDRAKEARALAEQMNDPEAKRTMLKNADDYERLAKRAEERAAGRWPKSK